MQVTKGGKYFPAGITRFIIPGRILRIKADMRVLSSNRPLHEKKPLAAQPALRQAERQRKSVYYAETGILVR